MQEATVKVRGHFSQCYVIFLKQINLFICFKTNERIKTEKMQRYNYWTEKKKPKGRRKDRKNSVTELVDLKPTLDKKNKKEKCERMWYVVLLVLFDCQGKLHHFQGLCIFTMMLRMHDSCDRFEPPASLNSFYWV